VEKQGEGVFGVLHVVGGADGGIEGGVGVPEAVGAGGFEGEVGMSPRFFVWSVTLCVPVCSTSSFVCFAYSAVTTSVRRPNPEMSPDVVINLRPPKRHRSANPNKRNPALGHPRVHGPDRFPQSPGALALVDVALDFPIDRRARCRWRLPVPCVALCSHSRLNFWPPAPCQRPSENVEKVKTTPMKCRENPCRARKPQRLNQVKIRSKQARAKLRPKPLLTNRQPSLGYKRSQRKYKKQKNHRTKI